MNKNLEKLRRQIDNIDKKILILLAKRMDIVKKIGKFKKENNISPLDKKRWDKVLDLSLSHANSLKLSKEFVKNIYSLIHKYSVELQRRGRL